MSTLGRIVIGISLEGARKFSEDANQADKAMRRIQQTAKAGLIPKASPGSLPPVIRDSPLGFNSKGVDIGGFLLKWGSALFLFEKTMQAMWALAQKIKATFEEGFNLYVKAAQLGQAPGQLFAAQQAGAAAGMSPEQVQEMLLRARAGNQGRNLNTFKDRASLVGMDKEAAAVFARFADYTVELNRTSGVLYSVTAAIKILQGELQVMWHLLAEQMSGAIHYAASNLADLIHQLNKLGVISVVGKLIGDQLVLVTKAFEAFGLMLASFGMVLETITKGIANVIITVTNKLRQIPGAKQFLGEEQDTFDLTAPAKGIMEAWKNFFTEGWDNKAPEKEGNRMPPTPIYIPPAGQWEKLGLSFGAADASNPAAQTAKNTGRMVNLLEAIVKGESIGAALLSPYTNAP